MASLEQTLSSIRIELSDRDKTMWQDDELIRAIEKTCSLMSRLLPKKSVVTATLDNAWIDGNYVDISSVLDADQKLGDAILRVEYPTGSSPPEFIAFEVIGDYLWLKTNVTVEAGKDIRVIYQGVWTPPSHITPGDYPPHLNDVLIIGASGQALIYKAENILQQAAGVFETLAAPTAYTFVKPTAPSLPTVPTKPIAPSVSFTEPTAPSLPSVPTAPTAPTLSFTAAEAAMAAVATEITAAKAKLTSGEAVINSGTRGENVAQNYGVYGKVVMDGTGHRVNESIARLRQVENILNKYSAEVTAFGSEANAYANNVSGLISLFRSKVELENFVAASLLQEYASEVAAFNSESNAYGNNVNALVSLFRSQGELENIGASVYASEVNAYVARINGQKAKADALLDIAGRFLASGQSKINEFLVALGYKPELHKSSSSAEQRS